MNGYRTTPPGKKSLSGAAETRHPSESVLIAAPARGLNCTGRPIRRPGPPSRTRA